MGRDETVPVAQLRGLGVAGIGEARPRDIAGGHGAGASERTKVSSARSATHGQRAP
jgi:hypothetical protein